MEYKDSTFTLVWNEYEKVILNSLITSFGLDIFIKDQHGGDVDTIHNVRKIGLDDKMHYKNNSNKNDYENLEAYDTAKYHSDDNFRIIKREARNRFDDHGEILDDAYVLGNKLIPRNNPTIDRYNQAQLDHVIPAHKIHEDRGRVLAEIDGIRLANTESNLRFTNAFLNRNKSDMSVDEYIRWCEDNPSKVNWNGKKGEPLPESVKSKLRAEYFNAKKEYDAKLIQQYYTSSKFVFDASSAALKRGAQMAIRQAVGFVFLELYISVKKELQKLPNNLSFEDIFRAISIGLKKGLRNIENNRAELLAIIGSSFVSGVVSSLVTTLINTFATTSKEVTRCIRQVYASISQAGVVLLVNPDNLELGDRIKQTSAVLATGASAVLGTLVQEKIKNTALGMNPYFGDAVQIFSATLVSGLLSCTFLLYLDRSKWVNSLVTQLNKIPSDANNYKEIAELFEKLASDYSRIDYQKFKEETSKYKTISENISKSKDEYSLNTILLDAYKTFDINLPWNDDFDTFMGNPNNHLTFS